MKIAKFDRPSFCQSAVVSTAPSCTIFSYLTLKNVVTLKFRLGITQSLEQAQFDKLHTSSHSSFIVTTAVFCIVYEIKRDKGRQSQFFTPPLIVHNSHLGKRMRILSCCFLHNRARWIGYIQYGAKMMWKIQPSS